MRVVGRMAQDPHEENLPLFLLRNIIKLSNVGVPIYAYSFVEDIRRLD